MEIRVLRAIQRAVQSITDCTSPVIEVGGVLAKADGLRSPYATHHQVSYEVVETRSGELIASSSRYSLVIQTLYAPEHPPEVEEVEIVSGLVWAWEGGYVPSEVVRPVLDLAERLGLPHLDGDDARLVRAYVALPRLAAFHLGRPVFWLADRDNSPLEIGEYLGDFVLEVGGVSIYRRDPERWGEYFRLLDLVPLWGTDDRVGSVVRDDAGRVDDIRRADVASVVAARYRGETVFLARVDGPATLVCEDGGRVTVDGYCVTVSPASSSQKALARM